MSDYSPLNEHESAFIDAFVIGECRERYRTQLASRKRRGRFLDRLNHRFLNDVHRRLVSTSPRQPLPSPPVSCYVIASEDKYDGTFVPLDRVDSLFADALFGILVSYIPGKLLAYRAESPADILWISSQ